MPIIRKRNTSPYSARRANGKGRRQLSNLFGRLMLQTNPSAKAQLSKMNIQKRLAQLENAAGIGSELCRCTRQTETRVIEPDRDRTEEEFQSLLIEAQKGEKCEWCKKLIERRLIIIESVKGNNSPLAAMPGVTFATFDISSDINAGKSAERVPLRLNSE